MTLLDKTPPDPIAALESDPRVIWNEDILRYGDTDANGHINNTTFSVLAESGRVHLFFTRLTPTLPEGVIFVIAKLGIDFKAEMHFPGTVRTGTWVSRIGRSSIAVEQVIVNDGRIVATTEAVCVLMDAATRRSTPFPDETRRVAEGLLRASSG